VDTTELKRLLESLIEKLRESKNPTLTRRVIVIVISSLLAYLGLDPFT
jgi:hypothetical protein